MFQGVQHDMYFKEEMFSSLVCDQKSYHNLLKAANSIMELQFHPDMVEKFAEFAIVLCYNAITDIIFRFESFIIRTQLAAMLFQNCELELLFTEINKGLNAFTETIVIILCRTAQRAVGRHIFEFQKSFIEDQLRALPDITMEQIMAILKHIESFRYRLPQEPLMRPLDAIERIADFVNDFLRYDLFHEGFTRELENVNKDRILENVKKFLSNDLKHPDVSYEEWKKAAYPF